jgi:hypothetical protein
MAATSGGGIWLRGVTHSLLGWLLRLGASPTLLHEGARIIDDELVHAELAFEVLREAGGGNVVLGGALGLYPEPGLSLLANVCAQGTRVFRLGETVAVRLFKRLPEGANVEVARRSIACSRTRCGTATLAGCYWSGCRSRSSGQRCPSLSRSGCRLGLQSLLTAERHREVRRRSVAEDSRTTSALHGSEPARPRRHWSRRHTH